MKANPQILDVLNDVLTAELTAINQYFLHAKMLQNWGYNALAKHVRDESIDEMRHAEELCERILYLEGVPNLQRLGKLKIGESPKEQLENDLAMEYDAVKRFNDGIKVCRDLGDNGTEDVLRRMLVSEEKHVDWIETQLGLISKLGEVAYLAEQLKALPHSARRAGAATSRPAACSTRTRAMRWSMRALTAVRRARKTVASASESSTLVDLPTL
jgi:bacterioferritin